MSTTVRYAFRRSLPVMAGYLVLGMGFGMLLEANGYGIGWALFMSLLIYAGSMQYVAIDLLAGGASLLSAALMTVMVNIRHLFYGISMLERYRDTKPYKPYLIFSLTDETYSLVCSGQVPEGVNQKQYYFFVSFFNQIYWAVGSAAGSVIGSVAGIDTTGIDFSMTALFLVVFLEQWRGTKDHMSALIGVGASLICLLLFGPDGFIIPAMISITVVLLFMRRQRGHEQKSGEAAENSENSRKHQKLQKGGAE